MSYDFRTIAKHRTGWRVRADRYVESPDGTRADRPQWVGASVNMEPLLWDILPPKEVREWCARVWRSQGWVGIAF